MNVLILAAGSPAFDMGDGDYPLCLTEFDGVPLIEKIVEGCSSLKAQHFVFALRENEVNRYHLDNVVRQLVNDAYTVRVSQSTRGAACTALLCAEKIDNDDELLIISANELLNIDPLKPITSFREKNADAGAVIFHSVHPRYSYVRIDDSGAVVEAAEKNPISSNATAGFYWYRKGSEFVSAAEQMIRKGAQVDGLFYVCPVFNQMILGQKHITTFRIDSHNYQPLKTERQFRQYDTLFDTRSHS